jgi:hypothetical protein
LNVTRADFPAGFTQPGKRSSIFAGVKSASMVSWFLLSSSPMRPVSVIGILPLTAGPKLMPRRRRAASSSTARKRKSAC